MQTLLKQRFPPTFLLACSSDLGVAASVLVNAVTVQSAFRGYAHFEEDGVWPFRGLGSLQNENLRLNLKPKTKRTPVL
jgi:hypothetical protein